MTKLKELRKNNGISLKDISNDLGIDKNTLKDIEDGIVYPTDEFVEKLCNYLNVSSDILLTNVSTETIISKNKNIKKLNKRKIIWFSLACFYLCTTIFFIYGLWCADLNYLQSDELIDQIAYRYQADTDSYTVVGFGKIESGNPRHLRPEEAKVVLVDEIKGKPVTSINDIAFKDTHIESIVLSKNIEVIKGGAFENTSLNYIEFNDNLKYINANAFNYTFMEELNFPESLECIEYSAFELCSSLVKVTFNSDIIISDYAFFNCYNLEDITFNGNAKIGQYAFASTRIEKIKFNGTAQIDKYAFMSNNRIELLTFAKATTIGQYAFMGTHIEHLDLRNVVKIEDYAFCGQKVSTVYFSKDIPAMESYPFQNVENVYYEGKLWIYGFFDQWKIINNTSYDEYLEIIK